MSTLRDKMSLGDILQVDESSKEILEILQAGTQNGVEIPEEQEKLLQRRKTLDVCHGGRSWEEEEVIGFAG